MGSLEAGRDSCHRVPGSLELGPPGTEGVRGPKAVGLAARLCLKLSDPRSPLSVLAPKWLPAFWDLFPLLNQNNCGIQDTKCSWGKGCALKTGKSEKVSIPNARLLVSVRVWLTEHGSHQFPSVWGFLFPWSVSFERKDLPPTGGNPPMKPFNRTILQQKCSGLATHVTHLGSSW